MERLGSSASRAMGVDIQALRCSLENKSFCEKEKLGSLTSPSTEEVGLSMDFGT